MTFYETKTGGSPKDCKVCGRPYKEHSFKELRVCWHNGKSYIPDQYKPEKPYQKGQDRT